jgi:RNA polymerase sigma-70 factor (ECF subfamily)
VATPRDSSEQEGRNAAFRLFIEPELPVLLRVARGLTKSSVEADDLVQETIIRAFNAILTFDGSHPRAWLLTILRNTNMNMHRRKRPDLVDDWSFLESYSMAFGSDTSLSAEEVSLNTNLSEELITGIKMLDQCYREVLFLIDIEGLNYTECAKLLGVPVGTITSRLSRARQRLRKYLVQSQAFEGRYS